MRAPDLIAGLLPYPTSPGPDPTRSPLSNMGAAADESYAVLPLMYEAQLDLVSNYVHAAVPPVWQKHYVPGGNGSWDARRVVWQTDKDAECLATEAVQSWREGKAKEEGWKHFLMTDEVADRWVAEHFAGSLVEKMWRILPSAILRADTLRYLLLAFYGGIYSDVDTLLVKPPSQWSRRATLYRDGEGWLGQADRDAILSSTAEERDRIIEERLGKPRVVVGVEAELDQGDWQDWVARPLQLIQWTIAAAPFHPITLLALLKIQHTTSTAVAWAQSHAMKVALAGQHADQPALDALQAEYADFRSGWGHKGLLKIMNWTGPGVWTDAVMSYLGAKYGVQWTDLRGLKKPLRVGDVLVLPRPGFNTWAGDPEEDSGVVHLYRGSWKP